MVIFKLELNENIVVIYDKSPQESCAITDVANDIEIIEEIKKYPNQRGIIYYTG